MKKKNILLTLVLFIIGLTFLYPFMWMLITSLKTAQEVNSNPLALPQKWLFSNYIEAINAFDFFRYLMNSTIYTIGTVLLTVISACMFAYAAARMRWKLQKFIQQYMQIGLMIPIAVIILSQYLLMRNIGLKNTYLGLILVYTASALPIGISIIYAYLRALPFELEESAYIDGCGVIRAFINIILPLIKPAIFTLIIIVFMNYSWNEFFIAFITVDELKMRSIPVALQYFSTFRGTEWGLLGACLVITSIPSVVLYLFGSEKIESALTVAGVIK